MRLQTELNKRQSEMAALKEQLSSLRVTVETLSTEKLITENQLMSKLEKLDASEERAVSLSNELAAVRDTVEQLQEQLRETMQQIECKQTLVQEKDKVCSTRPFHGQVLLYAAALLLF